MVPTVTESKLPRAREPGTWFYDIQRVVKGQQEPKRLLKDKASMTLPLRPSLLARACLLPLINLAF